MAQTGSGWYLVMPTEHECMHPFSVGSLSNQSKGIFLTKRELMTGDASGV